MYGLVISIALDQAIFFGKYNKIFGRLIITLVNECFEISKKKRNGLRSTYFGFICFLEKFKIPENLIFFTFWKFSERLRPKKLLVRSLFIIYIKLFFSLSNRSHRLVDLTKHYRKEGAFLLCIEPYCFWVRSGERAKELFT